MLWIKQDSTYKMTGTNIKLLLLFGLLIRASLEHTKWDKLACFSFPSAGTQGSTTSGQVNMLFITNSTLLSQVGQSHTNAQDSCFTFFVRRRVFFS